MHVLIFQDNATSKHEIAAICIIVLNNFFYIFIALFKDVIHLVHIKSALLKFSHVYSYFKNEFFFQSNKLTQYNFFDVYIFYVCSHSCFQRLNDTQEK